MKLKIIAIVIFTLCTGNVLAQSSPPQRGTPPPVGKNPAIDAALSQCAASVTKDANGRPDRTAMDACMSAKGFKKPPQRDEKKDTSSTQ
jgi:hypothetical protein